MFMKKILFKKKKKGTEDTPALEHIKNYSTVENMIYMLKKVASYQKILIPFLLLSAITQSLLEFIWVVIPKYVIEIIEYEKGSQDLILLVVIAFFTQWAITGTNSFFDSQIWWRFINVRMHLLSSKVKKALTMKYQHLENPTMLEAMEKAGQAGGGNGNGLEGMLHVTRRISVNLVTLIISSTIIFTLHPILIVIMFVLSTIFFLLLDWAKRMDKIHTWDALAKNWRRQNYMNRMTTDFEYGKDIRLFGMKEWLFEKLKSYHNISHEKLVEHKDRWIKVNIANQGIVLLQEAVLYIWLIYSVLYRDLSIANFFLYFGTIKTFQNNVSQMLDAISDARKRSLEINDFRTFVEYPEDEDKDAVIFTPPKDNKYKFQFEDVSFCYNGSDTYALKNINLTLEAGKRLAVVGLNGAGKTTFIKLLCRLYEPTKGRILLNGIDIKTYDLVSYQALLSPVFQEINLFAFPLSENVSMKTPELTDKDLALTCLGLAGLSEKIESLPNGIQTEMLKVLHEDGIDLSGGEKQKMALARALYKDSPIIVLDEPTAALDALAEYKLYMDFDKMIGNKTSVYISHRLSSTRFCHAIAMFKGGEIIEYGTHDELLTKDGEYASMFAMQAKYYKDNEEGVFIHEV